MMTKPIDYDTILIPHHRLLKLVATLALATLLAGCGRETAEAPDDEIAESRRKPQASEAALSAGDLDTAVTPVTTAVPEAAVAAKSDAPTALLAPTNTDLNPASTTPAAETTAAPLGTDDSQQAVAAASLQIRERYRAFYEYEQKFKTEDPVCLRLTAENENLYQKITSNQTVMANRLQKDPEWNRIRKELADAQQARDQAQRERALQQRSLVISNALRRSAIEMQSGKAVTTSKVDK